MAILLWFSEWLLAQVNRGRRWVERAVVHAAAKTTCESRVALREGQGDGVAWYTADSIGVPLCGQPRPPPPHTVSSELSPSHKLSL